MKSIWHYIDQLPFVKEEYRISIGEGQTPLVRSKFIGPSLGLKNLFFKLENLNPTGSYKDRFAALFVSMMAEKKASHCVATSSGNTGAALAAYCAAAGIKCYLAVVDGAPLPKLQQMQIFGGEIIIVDQFGIDVTITNQVFEQLKQYAEDNKTQLPVSAYSFCPDGMQGVQTIAWEILDELSEVHHIFSPSGGGGLTLAIAKAVLLHEKSESHCKVHCVQPTGNNTIAGPLRQGLLKAIQINSSSTGVSGLQVPGILDGTETIKYCRETNGTGYLVDDSLVYETQQILARKEGIFCEPAGAVSVSALGEALKNKEVDPDSTIVCVVTGSGFKDMENTVHRFGLTVDKATHDVKYLTKFLSNLKK